MRKRRIFVRFTVIVSLVLLVVMTLSGYVLLEYLQRSRIEAKERSAVNLTRIVANLSAFHIARFTYFYLDQITVSLQGEAQAGSDVLSVIIYDKSGKQLNPSGTPPEAITTPETLLLVEEAPCVNRTITGLEETVGRVRIVFSLEADMAEIARARGVLSLFVLLVIVGLAVSMIVTVSFIVAKPISALAKAAEKIAAGDFDGEIAVTGSDEIGFLARSFNAMTRTIRQNFGEIREKNEALRLEEDELMHTRNYLQNVFDSMPSILVSVDADGAITQWNTAAEIFCGVSSGLALGRKAWEVLPFLNDFKTYFDEVMRTRRPRELSKEKLGPASGRYFDVSFYPLAKAGLTGIVIRLDDVTDAELKEEQLLQAQKMETIGTLAGGLAHDFNNVLGGVLGTASIVMYGIERGDLDLGELGEDMRVIKESAERAAEMVRQLLSLSRKAEMKFEAVDLDAVVANVIKLCRNTIDKSVEIAFKPSPESPVVKADMRHLEQVLLNLCVNAAHAMTIMRPAGEPQGGPLRIEIARAEADDRFLQTHPDAEPGAYWAVRVRDDGVGMDERTKSKIFDPFFTTKSAGHGSGLGLSMVYNIVRQHRGIIDVDSEPGKGSTFSVYLPALSGEASADTGGEASGDLHRGTGTILVIDDEEVMRSIARKILGECGYDVLTASGGEEGIEIFGRERGNLRLVVLDMSMPRMSGKETYVALKLVDPGLKVLLASGYKEDSRIKDLMQMGVNGFIQKPFTLRALAAKVREILGD